MCRRVLGHDRDLFWPLLSAVPETPRPKDTKTTAAIIILPLLQRDFGLRLARGWPGAGQTTSHYALRPPCDCHPQKPHTHIAVVFIQLTS
jgi:hypothetical protein